MKWQKNLGSVAKCGTRVAVFAIVGAVSIAAPAMAGIFNVDTIALTGVDDTRGPGLGPGVVYSTNGIESVTTGPGGQIAFRGDLSGGSTTQAIFAGTAASILPVASVGDTAPGVAGGSFAFVDVPSYLKNGTLSYAAGLTGVGIDSTNSSANFAVGGTAPLLRAGDQAPGIGNPLTTIRDYAGGASTGDHIAARGRIQGPGINSSTERTIFANDGSGAVQVVREGPGVVTNGLNVDEYYDEPTAARSGPGGGIVFSSTIRLSPTNTSLGNGFFHWNGSSITKVLRKDDGAPSTGGTVLSVSSIGNSDEFDKVGLFVSLTTGGTVTSANDRAFYSYGQSGLNLIVREGDSIASLPGSTVVQLNFSADPVSFGAGDVAAFRVNALDTPVATSAAALFLDRGGARIPIVIGKDNSLPGLGSGEEINLFTLPSFDLSKNGAVVFDSVIDQSGVSGPRGAWYYDLDGTYHYLYRSGDQFDVDPTAGVDLRTISSFSTGKFLNDTTFIANMSFTDGSEGLFHFSIVPEPATWMILGLALPYVGMYRRRN